MKRLMIPLLALTVATSCDKNPDGDTGPKVTDVTIYMGEGYANEVFYNLSDGQMKVSPRNSWDLAFSTNPMSSTVLINEGLGLELYTYPSGDKSDWDQVDTSGIGQWIPMFNSDTSWYYGAFDRNSMGHPDYGWGVYNMQNHDVVGDSLFVIKLADGSYKKLFIEKRAAMSNSYIIQYGDLDDQGEGVSKEIPCASYNNMNFIYFSFATGDVVEIEPESESWDLLFTRYYDESIPYMVTGVLTNMDREVAKVTDTDPSLADPASATFTTSISEIGSDWKEFDMGSFSYLIVPERSYFVRTGEDMLYKIVFTGTDGSASGMISFTVEEIPE